MGKRSTRVKRLPRQQPTASAQGKDQCTTATCPDTRSAKLRTAAEQRPNKGRTGQRPDVRPLSPFCSQKSMRGLGRRAAPFRLKRS